MKQTAILDRAQKRMAPGAITRDGFLGTERRRLVDLLEEDDAAVRRLGLTHGAIAARMRELRDAGAAGLGLAISVAPHFDVRVEGVRGKLPCPFSDGLSAKTNVLVVNKRLNREITYTDLQIHLIAVHGFYLGLGSTYRLDPADLATVLEVQPEPAQSHALPEGI